MSANKLFGNSASAKFLTTKQIGVGLQQPEPAQKRRKSRFRPLKISLILLVILECLYCIAIFSNIPFIVRLRNMYIETAMSTMSHHWLAEAFIPKDIIDAVVADMAAARDAQMGISSTWTKPTAPTGPENTGPTPPAHTNPAQTERTLTAEQRAFFELYWEIDQDSMFSYVEKNPAAVAKGWDRIKINEAGLDDSGTSIRTTMGEQVLAIDVENQILLVRVKGATYRGVLAIAKDPSRLHLFPSSSIGSYGQRAGTIAANNGGILAMTGSGFIDEGGTGNGGALAGAAMCDGKKYGKHFGWGYKRIELREDDRMYITDASNSYSDGTTDAVEFTPALIVDSEIIVDASSGYTSMNPRACLGQSNRGEVLMLVIEGRFLNSMGTDVMECADILALHDCAQALNLDGGTSAILWYDGEYVTRCSNTAIPEGRTLPNAWVYTGE